MISGNLECVSNPACFMPHTKKIKTPTDNIRDIAALIKTLIVKLLRLFHTIIAGARAINNTPSIRKRVAITAINAKKKKLNGVSKSFLLAKKARKHKARKRKIGSRIIWVAAALKQGRRAKRSAADKAL